MSITAKELAQMLNISAAAVSMALNDKPGVSQKTRKMVKVAAEKYGYDFDRIHAKKNNSAGSILFINLQREKTDLKRLFVHTECPFPSPLFMNCRLLSAVHMQTWQKS